MSIKLKFSRDQRALLHSEMKERASRLLELLDSIEPGEIPDDSNAGLICRDVQSTAKFLRKSFDT